VVWIQLAQDTVQRLALVATILNVPVNVMVSACFEEPKLLGSSSARIKMFIHIITFFYGM
jgi:hypothetical protein